MLVESIDLPSLLGLQPSRGVGPAEVAMMVRGPAGRQEVEKGLAEGIHDDNVSEWLALVGPHRLRFAQDMVPWGRC